MASSPSMEQLVTDVAELKRAAIQTAEILVDHSNRFDRLEARLDGVEGKLADLQSSMQSVIGRLDRLLAASLLERTTNAERYGATNEHFASIAEHFASIDRQLERLERRFDSVEQELAFLKNPRH